MEASPLTQQHRPGIFQPKIVNLYEKLLLQDEDEQFEERSEGFWKELFLHRPDSTSFRDILDRLSADDLIHLQSHTQEFVYRALISVQAHTAPSDENALETLTVFLGAVLSKRYTNPSSDIIQVIAGLDNVDATFAELVAALDGIIRNGRTLDMRRKALRTALSATAGAYQTGLVSYFTHRDLFPALMKFVQDAEIGLQDTEALVLLGLLANYNRFEFQNPYRMRLDDFVNDAIIKTIVKSVGEACKSLRDSYVAVQDDTPVGWGVSNTLSYIGLGRLSPASRSASPALSEEVAKLRFTELPDPQAAILLTTYDFVQSNKLFCFDLVTMPAEGKNGSTTLTEYISLTSYLLQHAHRSARASLYTYTTLFVLRILLEDQVLAKRICSEESKAIVRLCRQRQPFLPIVSSSRPAATAMLDVAVDGINHNLRRKLDVALYQLCLGLLHRIIAYLGATRTRLQYHWSELWRSLLSLLRFLNSYAADIRPMTGSHELAAELVTIIALSLTSGESFLPDPASYDDLFYKLVEAGSILTEFGKNYDLQKSPAIAILENVSDHYHALLNEGKSRFTKKTLSPREVSKIIKEGYDTLSIEAREGLDQFNKFREADYRTELKKIARLAVDDAKALVRDP